MIKRLAVVCSLILTLGLTGACSASLRGKAVQSAQTAHVAVGGAQDAEIALYATGAIPGFTLAQHQAYHAGLVKYFDAEAKVITVLQAWRAGDPPPATLPDALSALNEAVAVLAKVGPSSLAKPLTLLHDAMVAMQHIVTLTGGAK